MKYKIAIEPSAIGKKMGMPKPNMKVTNTVLRMVEYL